MKFTFLLSLSIGLQLTSLSLQASVSGSSAERPISRQSTGHRLEEDNFGQSNLEAQKRSSKYLAMMHAKSMNGLRSIIKSDQRLEVQRVKCKTELGAQRIPSSCFWVLDRENELHLIPSISEMRDSAWLKKLCLSRVETAKLISSLERALQAEHIPDECQVAMRNRIGDLRYQLESTSPQRLFEARFPVSSPDLGESRDD